MLALLVVNGIHAQSQVVDDQIIVKLTDAAYAEQLKSLHACIDVTPVMPHIDRSFVLVKYDPAKSTMDRMLDKLRKMSIVELAGPDRIITIPEEPVKPLPVKEADAMLAPMRSASGLGPNDPLFERQWHLKAISVPELWQVPLLPDAKRPVIAILDTGVDVDHPDLKDNIWTNEAELNGLPDVDDDGNGLIDDIYGWNFFENNNDVSDVHGHGTHCAGIAAAVTDNGIGIAGANPDAVIMPVRVGGVMELETGRVAVISEYFTGIDYAVNNGADIISMSFGKKIDPTTLGPVYREMLEMASEYAILVASSGNSTIPIAQDVFFPACSPDVIGVESSDQYRCRSVFSNYDDDPWHSDYETGENYELMAPGDDILSTSPGGGYVLMSGTSMSTPLVAGVISRLISVKDYSSQQELVRDLILSRGKSLGPIDAISAYEGKPGRIATIRSFMNQNVFNYDRSGTFAFTVANESDSTLTGLAMKVSATPASKSTLILPDTVCSIPYLYADARADTVVCSFQMNDNVNSGDTYYVDLVLQNYGQTIDSLEYGIGVADIWFDQDSIGYVPAYGDEPFAAVYMCKSTSSGSYTVKDTVPIHGEKMPVIMLSSMAFVESAFSQIEIPSTVFFIAESAFEYCKNLKSIDIPQSVSYIGEDAFMSCSSLEYIELPDSLQTLGARAFYGCRSLKEIDFPATLMFLEDELFSECSSLEGIALHDGLKYVSRQAFENCKSLGSIVLPATVCYMGEMAFEGCDSLVSVTCLAETPPFWWLSDDNEETLGFRSEDATLYVPAGCAEEYRAAEGWKLFGNIVELEPTGVQGVKETDAHRPSYDLSGRAVAPGTRGIIISGGRKLKF